MSTIEVLSAGPLTTVQDLGRPGWAHIGVPRSGAADRASLMLANEIVGNDHGAAALETTLVGPRLRVDADTVVALAGAPVDGVEMNVPIELRAGEVLKVGTARAGLRTYIAFRGGLQVPSVLGSAATDVLTGLGPEPLRRGDLLATGVAEMTGAARGGRACRTSAPEPPPYLQLPQIALLRIIVGPRNDWFTHASIKRLETEIFTASHASNRVGVRLDGPILERARKGELLSEGLVPGAIQVPPDGHPILLLSDHPTTGGYPVIAVVVSDDLRLTGQLRPGQQLRFES